jgi:hypothetical protein
MRLLAIFVPILTLALGGISQAAVLATPPIVVGDGTATQPMESLIWFIFNASEQPLLVKKVEPINGNGEVVGFAPDPFVLQPGQTGGGGPAVGANYPRVCRFTIQGQARQVRASACVVGTFTESVRNFCVDGR